MFWEVVVVGPDVQINLFFQKEESVIDYLARVPEGWYAESHKRQFSDPLRELTPEEYEAKVAAGKKIKLAPGGAH